MRKTGGGFCRFFPIFCEYKRKSKKRERPGRKPEAFEKKRFCKLTLGETGSAACGTIRRNAYYPKLCLFQLAVRDRFQRSWRGYRIAADKPFDRIIEKIYALRPVGKK